MWSDPTRITLMLTGGITALLAPVLLWLDFNKRANRAFAALLALKGLSILLIQLPALAGDGTTPFVFRALPYILIPLVPIAVYFASVFPRPRGILGRPGSGWILIVLVLVLEALYLFRHDLFWVVEAIEPAHPALATAPGHSITSLGPLSLLLWGSFPAFGVLALVFLHDYTRAEAGTQRFSHLLVGAGFTLNALFDGARQTSGLLAILRDPTGYPMAPWGWGAAFLPTLSLLPAIAAIVLVAVHRFGNAQEARQEIRFFIACGLALLTGLSPLLLPSEQGFFDGTLLLVLLALWRLSLPVLVSYSLLRYALFDIDVRLQAGIRRGAIAAVFGAVYFLISETVEGLISDAQGSLYGLGAAALLTVAIKPLEKFGAWASARIMPGAVAAKDAEGDPQEMYRQHCAMVMEDGNVTPMERRLLDTLATTWGLTPKQMRRIEDRVVAGFVRPAAVPA